MATKITNKNLSIITDLVPEKSTSRVTGVIKDEADTAVPSADITTLTLTLFKVSNSLILNSRDDVDIKNVNGGTVDSSGNLVMTFTPADNAITNGRSKEVHRAMFKWTYNAGAKTGFHEVEFTVGNLLKVT